jgi:hypothetical protein
MKEQSMTYEQDVFYEDIDTNMEKYDDKIPP